MLLITLTGIAICNGLPSQEGEHEKDHFSAEEERMNWYLNNNTLLNKTYQEEFCKAQNWSIEFGW